jgi:hypothetical protein
MIDIKVLWDRFCADNNTFQGGFFRPERDFNANVNSVSLQAFVEFTAQDEKSQQIDEWLAPFANTVNIIVTPQSGNWGLAAYPKDNTGKLLYGAYKAARSLQHREQCLCEEGAPVYKDGVCCDKETEIEKLQRVDRYKDGIFEAPINKIESSHWGACLEHQTKCPTFENPKLTQYKDGFKVAPRKVSVIVLDYYRNPVPAKFAYTIAQGNPQTGSGEYLIYDQANSTSLEWPESMIPYFLDKLQQIYSKFTRDSTLFQMNKATA